MTSTTTTSVRPALAPPRPLPRPAARTLSAILCLFLGTGLSCRLPAGDQEQARASAAESPLVTGVTFVIFDLETTGLSPRQDRIVEIGAVKFGATEVLARRSWLINPRMPMPPQAQEVHGITDDMVRDAPFFEQVYPEFTNFIDGCVLVAHNAKFDVGFIRAEAKRARLPVPEALVLDTLRLARASFPDAPGHSLGVLADYLGIPVDTLHRGGKDADLTRAVFLAIVAARGKDCRLDELVALAKGGMRLGPAAERHDAAGNHAPASQSPGSSPASVNPQMPRDD